MREIVTYVEMTSRDQLVPAPPVPGLALKPLGLESPLLADVHTRVGTPYGWRSATRTRQEWTAGYQSRTFCLLSFEDDPAGVVSYDLHPGDDVEIAAFGLLPEFVGKGIGGYALTLGIQQAWELVPEVSRVWLHTSTLDHPRALPNYHRRGFRTFKTEERER
ncbi:GNAT family N-acetyltransferase [Actinomadura logoneensis]|uniref:GNAT family N-acetyltransferase n=1 Tax=Actinomadura logoneensis TaxID=2293572 RepID=A0A372J9N0_9ACTN|nr:GNAT family N-acetyltransferase [Actinomadura logoneensis]RFU36702.1 GNAT family N-acetyltransferase [Actinomadura logoneensis]